MKPFFKRKSIAASVAVLVALVAAFFSVVFAVSVPVLHEASSQNTTLRAFVASQDTFRIPLKDSVVWLEMEKNTDYTICVDGSDKGLWKVKDFSYEKAGDCIQLNSGNYVKNGKIQYVTQIGHVVTFNLLVGMKYIDLSTQEHSLGSELHAHYNRKGMPYYRDPVRNERIDKILVVDEYKVTECEFVQALWDSIPAQLGRKPYEDLYKDNEFFWVNKKKSMVKDGYCDAHDSAAVRVYLYHAFVYANNRSLRDGFKPVYSLSKTENLERSFYKKDGSFNVENVNFSETSNEGIHVKVDENADGYRLPYYDEWMALVQNARGPYMDSASTAQYAWFGFVESDDFYANLDKSKIEHRWSLKNSCGEWKQKSRPVGMLKPNKYGLYDMLGLVCESTLLPGKSLFHDEVSLCKGGFLTSSADELSYRNHCDDNGFAFKPFKGLRLVRQIK